MRRTRSSDDGFGTVLALAMTAVLLSVAGVVATLVMLAVTRHRAEAIADVAALAASQHATSGQLVACADAGLLAVRQKAVLLSCRLDGLDAVVTVGVRAPGRVSSFGLVRGRARAGRRNDAATSRTTGPGGVKGGSARRRSTARR